VKGEETMFYIILSVILLLLSNRPALAEDDYVETFQGIVNSTAGMPGYIVVNEQKLLLDDKVVIKDHQEKDAPLSDIRVGRWIYVAAAKRSAGPTALRIYLLPRYIKDKERSSYPFMKREEESEK